MPGKVVKAEVPKLDRIGVMMNRLLGVLVPPIIAQPYVETYYYLSIEYLWQTLRTLLHKDKRQAPLHVC